MLALLLVIFSGITVAYAADENADLKKNLCGGANLSLSSGGSDEKGYNRSCTNPSDDTGDPTNDIEKTIQSIINILSVVVGIVAVFMIIISGFRYITSGGDSARVSSAKNTIIYAIVGLIVIALAQVIVRFVIAKTAP